MCGGMMKSRLLLSSPSPQTLHFGEEEDRPIRCRAAAVRDGRPKDVLRRGPRRRAEGAAPRRIPPEPASDTVQSLRPRRSPCSFVRHWLARWDVQQQGSVRRTGS